MQSIQISKLDSKPMLWHWALFFVFLALVGINSISNILADQGGTTVFALAILLAGIPHGTLDIEIIAQNLGRTDFSAKMLFITVYILCAAAMAGLWVIFAPLALAAFLVISIIHFGRDWRLEDEPFLGFMVGGALIALPALSHNAQVEAIFEILVGPVGGNTVADGLACISLPPLLASLVFCWVALQQGRYAIAINVMVCLIAAIVLPPLAAFALFFCGLHSPRHFRDAYGEAGGLSPRHRVLVIIAVMALSLGLGAGIFVQERQLSLDSGIIRTVFILLSILTLPHFLLEQWHPGVKVSKAFSRSP